MAERDWDAELRRIDAQIAKAGSAPPTSASGASTAGAAEGGPGPTGHFGARAPASPGAPAPSLTSGIGVYARLALAVALAVGIVFWPYSARCGVGLAAYLAAVGVVILSGVWSSIWTWRHRAARAHLLSLLLVLWGLVLTGLDVLPRVGYAVPTVPHPATWACG